MYFLNWNLTLHIVIVCTSFIFADDSIIFLANYGRLCTSNTEHLYFPLSIHILLALIFLYFPLDHFLMFVTLLRGICTFKIEHLYFLESLSILLSTWFIIFLALHVKAALPKLNILHFPILLHILPAHIVLYFPRSYSFVLPSR
jgi:hypothetical protein